MKSYNIRNYIQYKKDIEKAIKRIESKNWHESGNFAFNCLKISDNSKVIPLYLKVILF